LVAGERDPEWSHAAQAAEAEEEHGVSMSP
jgi:hypothetical protein